MWTVEREVRWKVRWKVECAAYNTVEQEQSERKFSVESGGWRVENRVWRVEL